VIAVLPVTVRGEERGLDQLGVEAARPLLRARLPVRARARERKLCWSAAACGRRCRGAVSLLLGVGLRASFVASALVPPLARVVCAADTRCAEALRGRHVSDDSTAF
jgi:hypothetical protein